MAEREVRKTIDFYEELVTLYPSCESWANNIQESLKLLTTDIAHTNFYSYLFNPSTYTFQSNIKCCTHEDEVKYNKMVENFENNSTQTTKLYKNGGKYSIIIKKRNKMAKNKWITFLAQYRKTHKTLSMKQAMKQGAVAYRKQKKK